MAVPRWRTVWTLLSLLNLLATKAFANGIAPSASAATELTVRVRMTDGSVKRVQATPRDTIEDVCERLGCDVEAGVAVEAEQQEAVEASCTLKELSVGHGGWLYMLRDPAKAGVDTAAAIRRMREARKRATRGGGVKEVKTLGALQQELKAAKGMLVVVDFYADWCGPCKQIAPAFTEMSKEFPKAVFLKVNVDTNSETAQKFAVQSMPTFVMLKNGKKVDEIKGREQTLSDRPSHGTLDGRWGGMGDS